MRRVVQTGFAAVIATFGLVMVQAPQAHAAVASVPSRIASLAYQNIGDMGCGLNSAGEKGYDGSCNNPNGIADEWCSEFAMWVWSTSGASIANLGSNSGTFLNYVTPVVRTPAIGDAVLFSNQPGQTGTIQHVAIVWGVSGNDITPGPNQAIIPR